jgi:hypothetical protein
MAEADARNRRITSANVMFCLDTTGSMAFAINAVKEAIIKVAEIYMTARIDMRVGLIEFRDRVHANESGDHRWDGGYHTLRMIDFGDQGSFTDNINSFGNEVEQLSAQGGGPHPESSFDAMAHAARESSWKEGSTKVIIHITDAAPRIPDYEISNIQQLRGIMSDSGIEQIFVVAPMNVLDDFEHLGMVERYEGHFALVSYHELDSNPTVEGLVEVLEVIAQTSSDSITESDGGDDDVDSDSENPFDEEEEAIADGDDEGAEPSEADSEESAEYDPSEDEAIADGGLEGSIRDSAKYSDSDGLFDD